MQRALECTGPSVRYYLWMGRLGTGIDISDEQAPTFLIPKDYVPTPMPELEKQLKLLNMKQHLCGIVQCNDPYGQPFTEPLPYCLYFNNLSGVSHWIASGEKNADGIFHVHVIYRTSQRSDSLRRSMISTWNNLSTSTNWVAQFHAECTTDCLKLQKCYKPESMLCYLLKQPEWVISNTDSLLDLSFSIRHWGLYQRFLKTDETPDTSPQMNAMTKEIVDLIITSGAKTIDDLFRANSETMSKYLHRPGLDSIIRNCFAFVKATGGGWALTLYKRYDPTPNRIHQILLHQGICPSEFDEIFHAWLTKTDSKRNTIILQGPSNTGKSAFIKGLKQCIPWGEIVNTNSGFAFEGLLECTIGVWEEPLISVELAEKTKQVMEGMTTSIPVKYKKPQMLPRTPIIVTTNHDIWRFCTQEEEMFRNRSWIFQWTQQCKDLPYLCRASEHCCQCYYCTASRSCSSPSGESEPCKVQRGNQPLSPGEQGTIRSQSPTNMGTRSMCDPGEGTSRSYDRPYGSDSFSTTQRSSDSTRCTSSTSTTTQRSVGRRTLIRSSHPRKRSASTESSTLERLESDHASSSDGHDSGTNGSGRSRKHSKRSDGRRTRTRVSKHVPVSKLGCVEAPKALAETFPIPPQQCGLDRFLVTIDKSHETLFIPSQTDWQAYLSYIFQKYHG
nr:nonstructural protein 1 [Psittaciform chaphamaparvovirus 5]